MKAYEVTLNVHGVQVTAKVEAAASPVEAYKQFISGAIAPDIGALVCPGAEGSTLIVTLQSLSTILIRETGPALAVVKQEIITP